MMVKKLKDFCVLHGEAVRYLFTGGATTFIALAAYYVLRWIVFTGEGQASVQAANATAWFIGLLFAYAANRAFVFQSRCSGLSMLREAASFAASRVATLLMESGMMAFAVLAGIDDRIMKIIATAFVIVANYVLSKFLVFTKKKAESSDI